MKRIGAVLLVLAGCRSGPQPEVVEQAKYVRLTARGAAPECSFTSEKTATGLTIRSVTGSLAVAAEYDSNGALIRADATLGKGETAKAAHVEVKEGKARILRTGQEPQEFEAPPGIIVTSAPDWTDTYRICRLWNRAKGGKQEFPGLWIHPVQPAQRLTFTAERIGTDVLDGMELDRLSIRLRGNSAYEGWADPAGRMIKLVSLPVKEGSTVLVLEGFEAASVGLTATGGASR